MTPPSSELLRSAGLRRTPVRLRVLDVIRTLGRPLTHAELSAQPELQGTDDITLYRTLSALQGAGLVHRVHGVDGVWRTCAQPPDPARCPGNHAHLLCQQCGDMRCLLDTPMPRVDVPDGFVVEGRHFLAFGRCAACLGAKRPGGEP